MNLYNICCCDIKDSKIIFDRCINCLLCTETISESHNLFKLWYDNMLLFSNNYSKKFKRYINYIQQGYNDKNYILVYKYMKMICEIVYKEYIKFYNNDLTYERYKNHAKRYFKKNNMVKFYINVRYLLQEKYDNQNNAYEIKSIKNLLEDLENDNINKRKINMIFYQPNAVFEYLDENIKYKINIEQYHFDSYK